MVAYSLTVFQVLKLPGGFFGVEIDLGVARDLGGHEGYLLLGYLAGLLGAMNLKGGLIISLGGQPTATGCHIDGCPYLEGWWEPVSLVMQRVTDGHLHDCAGSLIFG